MIDIRHTGGCRCGAVRFEASAEPHHVSYCHCSDCRKATGAPLTAFVGFMADEISFSGAAPTTFANGPVTRSFCGVCGSPIGYLDSRLAGRVYVMLGVMDAPERFAPTVHGWASEALPFIHINDDLPRVARTTVPRPDGTHT